MEAQLIFNRFQVYKTLIIHIKFIEKKETMLKTDSRMFIFSFAYATMKPKMTQRLFSAFKGVYPGLLQPVSNTPFTFFDVINKKGHRNGLTPEMFFF